jgi:hypothetical protein
MMMIEMTHASELLLHSLSFTKHMQYQIVHSLKICRQNKKRPLQQANSQTCVEPCLEETSDGIDDWNNIFFS